MERGRKARRQHQPAGLAANVTTESRRAGWFIGTTFSLSLLVAAIVDEKFAFLLKDVYHLNAGGSATVALISGIPSYLRVLIGAGSDAILLFGYRRRTYYAFAWA